MTKTTVYIAWGAQWDSPHDEFLGVFRTEDAARKFLAALQRKDIMNTWVTDEDLEG